MQVKDILTPDVVLTDPTMTLDAAAKLMQEKGIGVLPVGQDDRLVGVVTDRDIATRAVASDRRPSETTVQDVMSQEVKWVFDDASTADAAEMMSKHQIRRLPVINHDKRLVGIVALGDFAVSGSDIQSATYALSGVSQETAVQQPSAAP